MHSKKKRCFLFQFFSVSVLKREKKKQQLFLLLDEIVRRIEIGILFCWLPFLLLLFNEYVNSLIFLIVAISSISFVVVVVSKCKINLLAKVFLFFFCFFNKN